MTLNEHQVFAQPTFVCTLCQRKWYAIGATCDPETLAIARADPHDPRLAVLCDECVDMIENGANVVQYLITLGFSPDRAVGHLQELLDDWRCRTGRRVT